MKYMLLVLLCLVLASCGENKPKKTPDPVQNSYVNVDIFGPESSFENKVEEIDLTINASDSYQTEWNQTGGPSVFVKSQSTDNLVFIVPNVIVDQVVTFTAKVTSSAQIST